MKKTCISLMVLPFFLSCSDDSQMGIASQGPDASNTLMKTNDQQDQQPGYGDNIYDYAGTIHNSLIDAYDDKSALPSTVKGIINRVELLASSNAALSALKTEFYQPLSLSDATYLLDNATGNTQEFISLLGLSGKTRKGFSDFVATLSPLCGGEADYKIIYSYITNYEATIIGDESIPESDRKKILVVTSIVRHSAYYRRKPKKNTDIDWEFMITHIVASIEGSSHGPAEAITRSATLSIAENL